MEANPARRVTGWVLLLVTAAGFLFEIAWLFLLGFVMLLGWVGFVIAGPTDGP